MRQARILAVDDEESLLLMLDSWLSERGYDVVTAASGSEAIRAARTARPDLILLDILLPGVDGRDVCRVLKQDPATSYIPIIILSALGSQADVVRGLEIGADDYVTKPFSLQILTARIDAHLRRSGVEKAGPEEEAEVVPGYKLTDMLGKGSMGTVYRATQKALDRAVAVKILHKRLARDAEYVGLFFREAKLAAQLSHPNVVGAIDAGQFRGIFYFVMEYVEGESAGRVLERLGRVSVDKALLIGAQIARALEHAGGRGLIHRDVKPDNILLDLHGTAKLADLGLARAALSPDPGGRDGRIVGTPDYISPEQVAVSDTVDTRADVYSLGASLYHMMVGRPPFSSDRVLDLLAMHARGVRPWAGETAPWVSDDVSRALMTAMATEPSDRFQSPGEMAGVLERLSGARRGATRR